ncbi:uncharacterized protein [Dendropsophus ebraccatus]|uniref:uncharacterized protein n=1 Tax=Dendropsophus ebraccatus TaxID=150705 RepID=UPI0038320658
MSEDMASYCKSVAQIIAIIGICLMIVQSVCCQLKCCGRSEFYFRKRYEKDVLREIEEALHCKEQEKRKEVLNGIVRHYEDRINVTDTKWLITSEEIIDEEKDRIKNIFKNIQIITSPPSGGQTSPPSGRQISPSLEGPTRSPPEVSKSPPTEVLRSPPPDRPTSLPPEVSKSPPPEVPTSPPPDGPTSLPLGGLTSPSPEGPTSSPPEVSKSPPPEVPKSPPPDGPTSLPLGGLTSPSPEGPTSSPLEEPLEEKTSDSTPLLCDQEVGAEGNPTQKA